MRLPLPPFRLFETYFRKFFNVPKGSSLHFFDILQKNECLKIPKGLFFQIFRHYETVKNPIFFQRPVFFICDFFNFFSSKSTPQFLPKMKRFATVKDSSRFSALCDFKKFAGDLQKIFRTYFGKISKNFFLQFSVFF